MRQRRARYSPGPWNSGELCGRAQLWRDGTRHDHDWAVGAQEQWLNDRPGMGVPTGRAGPDVVVGSGDDEIGVSGGCGEHRSGRAVGDFASDTDVGVCGLPGVQKALKSHVRVGVA